MIMFKLTKLISAMCVIATITGCAEMKNLQSAASQLPQTASKAYRNIVPAEPPELIRLREVSKEDDSILNALNMVNKEHPELSKQKLLCGGTSDPVEFKSQSYSWSPVQKFQLFCTLPEDVLRERDTDLIAYSKAMATYAVKRGSRELTGFAVQARTKEDAAFLEAAVASILKNKGVHLNVLVNPNAMPTLAILSPGLIKRTVRDQ